MSPYLSLCPVSNRHGALWVANEVFKNFFLCSFSLHWAFTVAQGLSLAVASRRHFLIAVCGLHIAEASAGQRVLQGVWASVVAAHGLSCPEVKSSRTSDQTVSWTGRWILNHWTTREAPKQTFLANYCYWFMKERIFGYPLSEGQRRRWHPTPVLLLGKSRGWTSLVGCSPWGREESETTERIHFHFKWRCWRGIKRSRSLWVVVHISNGPLKREIT